MKRLGEAAGLAGCCESLFYIFLWDGKLLLAESALWESGGGEGVLGTHKWTCRRLRRGGRLEGMSCAVSGLESKTCSAWMGAGFILWFIWGGKRLFWQGEVFWLVCFFMVVIIYVGCLE